MSDHEFHRRGEGKSPDNAGPKAECEAPVSGAAAAAVGRTIWDIVSDLIGAMKRPATALPVSLVLVGVIVLIAASGRARVACGKDGCGIELGCSSSPSPPTPRPVTGAATFTPDWIIVMGREMKKPYVLENVNVTIQVEDVKSGAGWERHVEWRIDYTVRALQPIKKTDKLFKEKYIVPGARTMRWFGSETEIDTTDGGYHVMFELAEGATRNVRTGATNVFDLPLEKNRAAFGQRIQLTPDQEFLSYENDEDVIGQLSITIDSRTLDISPVGQAAKRSKADGSVAPDGECRPHSAEGQRSMTARWEYMLPGEEVGIHFKVGERRRT